MGKTRDLFKKIGDTKETLHAKMGRIKDRNVMDLTEAEEILKEVARIHRVKVAKSHLTLCKPMDYTVHEILQAGTLSWSR